MTDTLNASRRPPTPPRAAAVAGIIFSALMIGSLGIIRVAVPDDPTKPGIWLTDSTGRNAVRLALNLVPFAGIAFLWFMGVLRNRVGALEDQFLATVFLGSGLLFVGSLFASAAAAGALVETAPAVNIQQANNEIYYFVRRVSYTLLNVFAIKMAGYSCSRPVPSHCARQYYRVGLPSQDLFAAWRYWWSSQTGCGSRCYSPCGYYWSAHRFLWRTGWGAAERFGHA